ncbi:4-diphosphocytidyl-2-C-methyl-D-erythritol kinase, chloroplastic [Porphyridium purpureum]|uniref:4-diphosphocytidyl-2-C-methyl-D-erythritol kinase, chloroplastic n=1 Tax=Porphyridium purpureum TaxID=35688 RepID=A0A5J4YNZ3_PORPP|nr:4-diphosphocytidyl-2-C-methyl-D-erythritol kinase, chloroplastic [Porphyridium purpureum]|eukprot:POR8855..scf295_9
MEPMLYDSPMRRSRVVDRHACAFGVASSPASHRSRRFRPGEGRTCQLSRMAPHRSDGTGMGVSMAAADSGKEAVVIPVLSLASPAKINVFLRILGKRPDGFHELASLFQAVSLQDNLHFERKDDDDTARDSMECNVAGIPTDDSNLILKALAVFRERTGCTQKFHVKLDKRVPFEAGLGGGSANAATTLWAVNEMCGRPATDEQLAEFGAQFGSDISFFLSSGTAYCTGRGEILRSLPPLTKPSAMFIVKPNFGLSTGKVFQTMDYERLSKRDPELLLNEIMESANEGLISPAACLNDLEEPSFRLEPKMGELKTKLASFGFDIVLMSGSGTSFFCIGRPHALLLGTGERDPRNMSDVLRTILGPAFPGVFVEQCTFVNRCAGQWYA